MHDTNTGSEAAANQEAASSLEEKRGDLEWIVQFNIALNEDVKRYYGFWNSIFKFAVLVFGSYSFASLFVGASMAYSIVAVVVSAISAGQLVFDFKDRQVRAKIQHERYSKALTALKSAKDADELGLVQAKIDDIGYDDIDTSDICDALAVNVAIDRMGLEPTSKVHVGGFKRLTRYVIPWGRPDYKS